MTLSGQTWLCSAGETFDRVALAVYGDEKYACELLQANVALCRTPVFAGGEVLELPVVEVTEDAGAADYAQPVAPWKE